MSLLHDAYTALLSGLTTKTGNEINWEDEEGEPITVEPIDINKEIYKVRHYWPNGNKHWEIDYQKGQIHGKQIEWRENGEVKLEELCENGKLIREIK